MPSHKHHIELWTIVHHAASLANCTYLITSCHHSTTGDEMGRWQDHYLQLRCFCRYVCRALQHLTVF